MANIIMWIGIAVIVIGWLALAWQASKRMAVKDEIDRFTQKKKTMMLYRNYCWLTIGVGVVLLVIAILI